METTPHQFGSHPVANAQLVVSSRSVLALLLLLVSLASAKAPILPDAAVVASANAVATDAGLEVLAAGGNAFDAAIAVSATLGLVEPESSGIGGGGFFLLRVTADAGSEGGFRDVFIDAREKAPAAATRDMFLDSSGAVIPNLSVNGALAAAIPGLPAGWVHLAKHYGRLPLPAALAPAMRLARGGWTFGVKNAAMLKYRRAAIAKDAGASALFLRRGEVPKVGDRMRNPDYARTLKQLAEAGAEGFYEGRLAKQLVLGVRQAGGIWTETDLATYRLVERTPLRFSYRQFEIVTLPPPSSGGVALAQMFNILGAYEVSTLRRVPRLHLLTEVMRRAYRDRAIYLGDPDFVAVPVGLLTSEEYAAGIRASINTERAMPSELLPGVAASPERAETTHFSIIDREGNLAAVTQTVNLPYGNALVVPGTGFLLNNEMDDFSVKPGVPNAFGLVGDDANAVAPGKRPLSSMTPSFLIAPERVALVGTPGGSRIISMVFFAMLDLMNGSTAQAAIDAPRVHHQYLPDVLVAEKGALSIAERDALNGRGFALSAEERFWGNMQIAIWNTRSGAVDAGSDRRWGEVGKAATSLLKSNRPEVFH